MSRTLRRFKSRPQSMPLFADAWIGSQSISLMTPEEEGAYVRLLLHAWRSDTCTLPADDASLAVLSRLGERWNTCSDRIRSCFSVCVQDASRIFNEKQYEIRMNHEEFWRQRQVAGIASGKSRSNVGNKRSTRVEHVLNKRIDLVRTSSASASASASALKPPSPTSSSTPLEGGGSSDPGRGRRTDGRNAARITVEDLKSDCRLEVCYQRAIRVGIIGKSRSDREHYWAAAVHALKRDPVGAPNLFAWMVKGKEWSKITEAEEDEGHKRLKKFEMEATSTEGGSK